MGKPNKETSMTIDEEKFSEACTLEEEGKYAEALQIYLALAEDRKSVV